MLWTWSLRVNMKKPSIWSPKPIFLCEVKSCNTYLSVRNWTLQDKKLHNLDTQNKIQFEIQWEHTFVRYILGEKTMLPTWYTNIELPLRSWGKSIFLLKQRSKVFIPFFRNTNVRTSTSLCVSMKFGCLRNFTRIGIHRNICLVEMSAMPRTILVFSITTKSVTKT